MIEGSFVSHFQNLAFGNPSRVFARLGETELTYGALNARASALAAHLSDHLQAPSPRAAVMMDNTLEAICTIYGLALAGIAWVPVNPRLVAGGLAYVLEHSAPHLLIHDEKYGAALADCEAKHRAELTLIHGEKSQLSNILEANRSFDASERRGSDLFAIMYTSGTTGPAKGVMVSHRMMSFAGEGVRIGSGASDGDVMFLWEPFCHIGGAQMLILPLLAEVHLAMVPRFSASGFWQDVERTGASHIHYLGGILQMLLKQPESAGDKAHKVRTAWGGGCPEETWRQFEARFSIPIRECYGMSEASSLTTVNTDGKVGSVGRAMDWLDVSIKDPDPAGKGEVIVSERQQGALFEGYYKNPSATTDALRDGVLHTGDYGSLDRQGNLHFHGRMNDSIRVRGELVSAWEVESVAASHPEVEECAAVGVTADIGEQEIKLFVRLQEGSGLKMDDLASWLNPQLAPFQRPAHYAVVSDFPRTPSQRIIKGQLG